MDPQTIHLALKLEESSRAVAFSEYRNKFARATRKFTADHRMISTHCSAGKSKAWRCLVAVEALPKALKSSSFVEEVNKMGTQNGCPSLHLSCVNEKQARSGMV